MADRLNGLIPRLAGQRVVVIGDVILDEYLIGTASRLSREAPVPVLEFEARQLIPGGAANPAANIAALGSAAVQIGVIGSDMAGTTLRQVLQARGIDIDALVTDSGRPTTVKTRIMAQMGLRFPQQVARMDTLSRTAVNSDVERRVRAHIERHVQGANAVLLSDYHVGLLNAPLVTTIHKLASAANVLLTADAQGDLDKYVGFGLVKCNADEARSYLRRDFSDHAGFGAAALELCRKLRLSGGMVITRGADGATLAMPNGEVVHCPAPAVTDVYDTVGAGDTAVAVLTLAAAANAPLVDAVTLANYASGVVVRHVGNYTPSPADLTHALAQWS